jgi:RHS repeat-associated protein
MYSPTGQKLGAYKLNPAVNGNFEPFMIVTLVSSDQFFGSRRLAVMDRLGSVGTYYPWGENRGGTNPQDTWSFGTYWTDSVTGLDYANNRYYFNSLGRFVTPDPAGAAAASLEDPVSWNRYAYSLDDPVNTYDPLGLWPSGILLKHVVIGAAKVAAGTAIIATAVAATASTGGAGAALGLAVAVIGGVGLTVSGGSEIACGIASNASLCDASTAVGNVTNPLGYSVLVASGGNENAATIGTFVWSVITFAADPTALNGVAAALGASDASDGSTNDVDGGSAPTVDYWPSSYTDSGPLAYSGGGGSSDVQSTGGAGAYQYVPTDNN